MFVSISEIYEIRNLPIARDPDERFNISKVTYWGWEIDGGLFRVDFL